MCRRNHLIGCAVTAFGLGMLVACFMESAFFCGFIGVVLAAAGVLALQKK